MTGPCDWPLLGCDDCTALVALEDSPGESPGQMLREAVEEAATEYLWRWTRRTFGLCTVTLRPCREDCRAGTWSRPSAGFDPVLINGEWHNLTCGQCGPDGCACDRLSEIRLPGPVHAVDEVKIDGAVVDPASYRVDNWTRLVRVSGDPWPVCQDMAAPDTEPDTFAVTYRIGEPVPKAGQLAAGRLACELAKAICGDDSCQLSGRVEEVTREGVTMILMPPDADKGETGIWIVDSFVKSQRAPRKPRVINPDTWLRQRRTTS